MNTKIIFIAVGVVAVLSIGGLVIAGYLKTPSENPSLENVVSFGITDGNTQVAVNTSQPGGAQPAEVDADAEYALLLQKISGQTVSFSRVASSAGAAGSVYALYAADIASAKKWYPTLQDFSMQIALIDLNDDGAAEAVVYEDLAGFCGSGGCPLDIYKKQGAAWVPLFNGLVRERVALANNFTNQYRDLLLSIHGSVGYQTNIVRFSWDGSQYRSAELMATWDGTTFNLPQI
jgi:hypothetical protein